MVFKLEKQGFLFFIYGFSCWCFVLEMNVFDKRFLVFSFFFRYMSNLELLSRPNEKYWVGGTWRKWLRSQGSLRAWLWISQTWVWYIQMFFCASSLWGNETHYNGNSKRDLIMLWPRSRMLNYCCYKSRWFISCSNFLRYVEIERKVLQNVQLFLFGTRWEYYLVV